MDENNERSIRIVFDETGTVTNVDLNNVGPAQLFAAAGMCEFHAIAMTAQLTMLAQNTPGIVQARSMPGGIKQ